MEALMLVLWLVACGGQASHDGPSGHHEDAGAHDHHGEHEEEPTTPEAHGEHEDHGAHGSANHRFDDVEKWVKVFDDPERDAWQKPEVVVSAMGITPGMTVADIGAGTGYFNPHLAAAVGTEGTVIAIDIERTLVDHMTARAKQDGTPQVKPRLAPMKGPALEAGEADRVLIVDTYHHIADRAEYFAKVKAGTAAEGRLIVVDLTKTAPFGPPAEERLEPETVKAELAEAGWTFVEAVDGLPHQYVLVFGK
jgi:cyclopropane fatty-acyl-phospholipid synthase-like methyltransferase